MRMTTTTSRALLRNSTLPIGNPCQPTRARRGISRATLLPLAVVLATCSDPFGPEELPCAVPPTLLAQVSANAAVTQDLGAIRSALAHAAGPLATALGSSGLQESLVKTTGLVANTLEDGLPLTGCRIVAIAADHLNALPDDPATRPDREAIRLALAIAAKAIAEARTR